MPDHDRPIGRRLGDEALKAAWAADPVARQHAHLLPDVRRDGGDCVVVARLDPEDARRLRCPEPGREGRSERDRDLPEDVTRQAFPDDALDTVDEPDRLDATLDQSEERSLVSFVSRVLPGAEADVGRDMTEPLAIGRTESREHLEPPDLLQGHHAGRRRRAGQTALGVLEALVNTVTT